MALAIIKGKVKTISSRIKDLFNNDIRWQHTNAENITDTTLYEDSDGFTIYVGGDGDLTVVLLDGSNEVTYYGVLAGTFMPIIARKVMASSTATNLVVGR